MLILLRRWLIFPIHLCQFGIKQNLSDVIFVYRYYYTAILSLHFV